MDSSSDSPIAYSAISSLAIPFFLSALLALIAIFGASVALSDSLEDFLAF
jgi:hypothetical protein